MNSDMICENKAVTCNIPAATWLPSKSHRFHVLTTKDDDGIYSAVALNLPGVGSCGDTEEEAMANLREAIAGALQTYAAIGEAVPWKDTTSEEIPFGAEQKWIMVNA
jgi:predicted RNase H-like HicB family nuclease